MQTSVEMTEIVCPRCGEEFAEWQSLSFSSSRSTACPRCGYDLASDPLVHEEGVWAFEPDDEDA